MFVVHLDRQRSFTGQVRRGLFDAQALAQAGHRVLWIAQPASELARRARAQGFDLLELPLRGAAALTSLWRAARALRGRGVEVLHCHGGRDHALARSLARLAGVPHLVRTKHNHTLPRGRRRLAAYRACDRVVAVSEFVRARLLGAGLDPARVVTIPDAVDPGRFRPRPRDAALAASLGLAPDALVVGHVSSLHERKGVEELLRALARLRRGPHGERLRGLFVGRQHARWEPLARELGLADRVTFAGFREDVERILPLCDVVALPSRHEALGTAALEAMAAGRALVVSEGEGLAEAVAETGVCVPARDPEALARAIEALLGDPARRAALGAAARERAASRYSDRALAARTLRLYEEILQPGARAADAARTQAGRPPNPVA